MGKRHRRDLPSIQTKFILSGEFECVRRFKMKRGDNVEITIEELPEKEISEKEVIPCSPSYIGRKGVIPCPPSYTKMKKWLLAAPLENMQRAIERDRPWEKVKTKLSSVQRKLRLK